MHHYSHENDVGERLHGFMFVSRNIDFTHGGSIGAICMYYSRHSPSDFLYVVAVLANCYNPCNSGEESGRKSQKYIFTSHNPSKGTEATFGHWTDRHCGGFSVSAAAQCCHCLVCNLQSFKHRRDVTRTKIVGMP